MLALVNDTMNGHAIRLCYPSLYRFDCLRRRTQKRRHIALVVGVAAVGDDDGSSVKLLLHFVDAAAAAAIIARRFGTRYTHTQQRTSTKKSGRSEPNVETLVNRTVSFALIPFSYLFVRFFSSSVHFSHLWSRSRRRRRCFV